MAGCYALLGALGWAYVYYVTNLPTAPGDFGASAPSWLASIVGFAIIFLLVPWALLPAPLLILGLGYLRRAARGRLDLAAGWVGALAAGVLAELSFALGLPAPRAMSPGYEGPPVPYPTALGLSAAFLAVGVALVAVLASARRSRIVTRAGLSSEHGRRIRLNGG